MLIYNKNILIRNAKDCLGVTTDIAISDGKIVKIGENLNFVSAYIINANELYVSPGFIDIHTHGGNGIDIVRCSESEFDDLTKFYASCGVTAFLPTIGTSSPLKLNKLFER